MKRLRCYPLATILAIVSLGIFAASCQTLKDIANSLTNLKKLQFKLGNVNGFKVNGLDISNLGQSSQINPIDYARLAVAISQKRLPVEFTLNVLARNPNEATTTGSQPTSLFLRKMDWTLVIDDRTTISGTVDKRLEIPANGQTTTIPFTMQLDLFKFFGDKGLDDLLNLAFTIGGAKGSSSHLKLSAKVTVEAFGQQITYPNELTIVDRDFTNP
jgi:hypothetical protein